MRRALLAVLLVLGLFFAACGGDEPTAGTEPGADETSEAPAPVGGTVVVTATEYAFDLTAELPAGTTTFSLVNAGEEKHFIDIVPLTDDAPPVGDLIELPDNKVEKFFAGPPNHIATVPPGETSTKTLEIDLQAGRYGYVCFFSEKGEKPHALLGMFGEFTVN